MRVIAGTARRLPLKTVPGMDTRPTTDRIKETLFNIMAPALADCRFLDLFSGSGAIGIEALSRGAGEAVFVENNRQALACIQENLSFTGLSEHARVLSMDVLAGIRSLYGQPAFTVIFMDPPYGKEYEKQVLHALKGSSLVDEDTLIVIEASIETDFSYMESLGFRMIKEKRYKTNKHIFAEQI
ncbi:16S rRNA (guanine(966)-N(2))-methyltransferase RsmD [Lachnospiraceae bacterium ASD4241]|uniref:16S rRNA (Guanine(966)-N(2))-methyltransferase RsmD n=2 Tax=Diplocloster modestus TaxID=2850322 RepID=A0ABS6K9C5_9FIRM|nr:16S rRNA (guanine(966)-N(2))-methyltransferase RsmD [Diplocloster modestus]